MPACPQVQFVGNVDAMDLMNFVDVPDLFLDAPLVWDARTKVSDRLCTDLCERCDLLIDQQGAPFTGRDRATFKDEALRKLLERQLTTAMPSRLGELELVGLNPLFRLYRYAPGHSFPPHLDYWYMPTSREITLVTVLCYLNDGFEGGETRFIKLPSEAAGQGTSDRLVVPYRGLVSVWQHQVLHEGARVTKGVKKVLRTDLMYRASKNIRRVGGIDSAEYRLMTSEL